jgi:hypothetical protein
MSHPGSTGTTACFGSRQEEEHPSHYREEGRNKGNGHAETEPRLMGSPAKTKNHKDGDPHASPC